MRSEVGALYRVGLRSLQVVPDGARDCQYSVTGQLHSPAALALAFTDWMGVWIALTTSEGIFEETEIACPSGHPFLIYWTSSSNSRCYTDGAVPILHGLVRCTNMQVVH